MRHWRRWLWQVFGFAGGLVIGPGEQLLVIVDMTQGGFASLESASHIFKKWFGARAFVVGAHPGQILWMGVVKAEAIRQQRVTIGPVDEGVPAVHP